MNYSDLKIQIFGRDEEACTLHAYDICEVKAHLLVKGRAELYKDGVYQGEFALPALHDHVLFFST